MLNLDCVPISTYCKETGETPEAINKRVQRGVWREGVQVLKVEGVKERWIDLSEVAKWARQNCSGNDSNLLIVFYVQIMPDDFVMQLHRF